MLITKTLLLAVLAVTVQSRALPVPVAGGIFQPAPIRPPGGVKPRPDEPEPLVNPNRPNESPETNFNQPDPNTPDRIPAVRPDEENQPQNKPSDEPDQVFKPADPDELTNPVGAICKRVGGCAGYTEPSPEVINQIVEGLGKYTIPKDNVALAQQENAALYDRIAEYIVNPIQEDKGIFYIDGASTAAKEIVAVKDDMVNVGTFYGGYDENIFHPLKEPTKEIVAIQKGEKDSDAVPADSREKLQQRWFQATSAVFAMKAKGDVFLLYPAREYPPSDIEPTTTPPLWSEAMGRADAQGRQDLSIFNSDEFPLLLANRDVANIYLVDSRFGPAWRDAPDSLSYRQVDDVKAEEIPAAGTSLTDWQLPVQLIGQGGRNAPQANLK